MTLSSRKKGSVHTAISYRKPRAVSTEQRERASQTTVEEKLDTCGNYDIVIPLMEEDSLKLLSEDPAIAKWGTIINGGTCATNMGVAVRFGAMDGPDAQSLFHFEPEKQGRYPAAPGEICGYKSAFEAMGTAAVLGNQFALSLYDPEGNFIESKEFTIVGVLNDQRDAYYNVIRTMAYMGADIEKIDFPQMFVYRDEIPDKSRLTAMILCSPDIGQYDVAKSLKSKGLKVCDGTRLTELSGIATVEYETQEELYSKAHLSYNDFYSSYLIPVFLGIV